MRMRMQKREMRMRVAPAAGKPAWMAAFAITLVATSSLVVIARSLPASYASVPGHRTGVPSASDKSSRTACPECGVIESTRHIPQTGHEVTVRLRDGTTVVFIETTPRSWRTGSRVMIIPGSIAAYRTT
jgi:hypothetical protein